MDFNDTEANDLLRSSMEVSTALDAFMREREDAAKAQEIALQAYDAEMLHILADTRQDDNELDAGRKEADHALLRHIGAGGDPSIHNKLDADEDEYNSHKYQSASTVTSDDEIAIRGREPTPSEKVAIRETARDAENTMLDDLCNTLASDDYKSSPDVLDELYSVQSRNFGVLMNYLDEYQPRPFVKAWGNDPEYIALGKKYGIKSKEKTKIRSTFATFKHSNRIKKAASTRSMT